MTTLDLQVFNWRLFISKRSSTAVIYYILVLVLFFAAQGCQTQIEARASYLSKLSNQYGSLEGDHGVTYEAVFDGAVGAKEYSVRYVCSQALVNASPVVENLLQRVISEQHFSKNAKEIAAWILLNRQTDSALSAVAPYYVSKLRDSDYTFNNLKDYHRYIHGDLTISHKKNGEEVILSHVPARNALEPIKRTGKYAIPFLLPLLADKNLTVRMNAYVSLQNITGLELPYDPLVGQADAAAVFLRQNGWFEPMAPSKKTTLEK